MNYDNGFIMQKTVDWSLLNDGMTIPVSACALLKTWDESILTHGVGKDIKVLIDGELYNAKLKNQNFVQDNWAGHNDVIQILDADYQQLATTLNTVPEEVYEASDDDTFFMADKTTSVIQKELLMKYRKIDRRIIRRLKEFYGYRDEISGDKIGDQYGESVVEAHHIDYFTKSQNNDSTNIIIISPNYHRIIHKNNPRFNRKKFQFEFENGEILKLKLYEHLKM